MKSLTNLSRLDLFSEVCLTVLKTQKSTLVVSANLPERRENNQSPVILSLHRCDPHAIRHRHASISQPRSTVDLAA